MPVFKHFTENFHIHIALKIGKHLIMATDALESIGHKITKGANFQISISTESEEETNTEHAWLSAEEK